MPRPVDFSRAPFLTIWETTRSCALACRHCRAQAILGRHTDELTTAEAKDLLDQVAAMGTPILVFSGGDALNRPDLEELIRHGKRAGLRLGAIPAATPRLTRERVAALKDAGLDQLALSLDAPTAELHDAFRGVPGSFAKTLEGAAFAREAGIPLQINTCLAAWNFPHLEAMVERVRSLDVAFWEIFFLIPIGRGSAMRGLSPEQFELAFERFHRLNFEERFIVKLTEAPHYRRYVMMKEGRRGENAAARIRHVLARPRGVGGAIGMSPEAVNAGKGFLFIDHRGGICPSGFLPIPAGDVRRYRIADVYRNSPLFRSLRDPSLLKGKCGACEFAQVCAGSRARANAATGNFLDSDPSCAYVPTA
ncbi:MAG TPA: TIGR04053 family radical SAM/SPASM domain-containing protein [Elusimicrobiota bacterium]|nr:TIGR04053 family radical SAM/SPASM domain-containing protein [Elusimicrobiota bacterium]